MTPEARASRIVDLARNELRLIAGGVVRKRGILDPLDARQLHASIAREIAEAVREALSSDTTLPP